METTRNFTAQMTPQQNATGSAMALMQYVTVTKTTHVQDVILNKMASPRNVTHTTERNASVNRCWSEANVKQIISVSPLTV
ncbi:unnamed protein product [Parnassius apollo]|uniref:(apollo) hypothetical protein n=1 Tax=Parnassius apollo TaxID=110799 RepID=A0A8S3XIR8_PARAO|nr:unnamed protein product [Parnassius apollo]